METSWRNIPDPGGVPLSKVESAATLIRAANPEDPENPKDPARYENSQKLLDYLSGKETPTDPSCRARSRSCARKSR